MFTDTNERNMFLSETGCSNFCSFELNCNGHIVFTLFETLSFCLQTHTRRCLHQLASARHKNKILTIFKIFIHALQTIITHRLFMRNNDFQEYKISFFIFHVDFVPLEHSSLLIKKVFFYKFQRTIIYLSTSIDNKTRLLDGYLTRSFV